jgi:hypothetical protein
LISCGLTACDDYQNETLRAYAAKPFNAKRSGRSAISVCGPADMTDRIKR